jgi:hypothetical protein
MRDSNAYLRKLLESGRAPRDSRGPLFSFVILTVNSRNEGSPELAVGHLLRHV